MLAKYDQKKWSSQYVANNNRKTLATQRIRLSKFHEFNSIANIQSKTALELYPPYNLDLPLMKRLVCVTFPTHHYPDRCSSNQKRESLREGVASLHSYKCTDKQ